MQNFLRKWIWILIIPCAILFDEAVLRLWCFDSLAPNGIHCVLPLLLALGALADFICSLFHGRGYRIITSVLLVCLFLLYGSQVVYYTIFSTFMTLFSVSGAGQVIGNFWREALQGIGRSSIALIAVLYPLILWFVFMKRVTPEKQHIRAKVMLALIFATFQLLSIAIIRTLQVGVMTPSYLYYDSYVPELSVSWFGAPTNLWLDFRQLTKSGVDEAIDDIEETLPDIIPSESTAPTPTAKPTPIPTVEPTPEPTPEPILPNVMDIDFESLIANEADSKILKLHEYFANRTPTMQNEYTGMFEGKNLVWIVAEGFSSWALDETHTPTLCKLASSGFVFENYYNPIWGVSTSDGEYVTTTGLLPKAGIWSYARSARNYMPFGFGNQFAKLNYVNYAFHDGTATYYERNKSHPNMGYDFYADGAGLDIDSVWPPSDLEMIDETTDFYMEQAPFNVYYMTISGHMYYTFYGNMMSNKHEDDVSDLDYTHCCRAYIASLMETDQAVALLLERLEAAGQLENTVIVFSGDHYPYGLKLSEIDELNGSTVERNFELYHSTLCIWTPEMEEPVHVSKYCSSLDVMPTLSNLFGLEYDSRLVMGHDIFSDTESLVVFQNRSFISDYGRYNAGTNVFTPSVDWDESYANDYAKEKLSEVNAMFTISASVLDNDYYSKVFLNND